MFNTLSLCCRLLVHILRGQRIINRDFPDWNYQQQQSVIQDWSAQLLRIAGVELKLVDSRQTAKLATANEATHGTLVVCNHISWIDIFVICAWQPAVFVSKSEIAKWPVAGKLVTSAGTLYIERERRRDALKLVKEISAAILLSKRVAIFPEGTTSDGKGLLHFHANLLQAAVAVNAPVQPLTLRFLDSKNMQPAADIAYIGTMSLRQNLVLLAQYATKHQGAHIIAELSILDEQLGTDRRELAQRLRSAMASALGVSEAEYQPSYDV